MQSDALSATDEAAIGWFVLLRDDDATEKDRAQFRRWLAADPAHALAWAQAERLWAGLDGLADAEGWQAQAAPVAILAQPHRTGFGLKIAAALALLAIGIGWQLAPVGLLADHRTAVGAREILRLADGSEVELGTASALNVDFTKDQRRVRLLTGEAFFSITPDAARPFVVEAGGGEILVRGTAFNVKVNETTRVSVTEHTVEISAGGRAAVAVTEGEEVSFDRTGVSAVRAADLDTVQAWRQGQLVFIDAPLDAVMAELGRYRHGHIRLLGGDLGQRRVTAVFDARKPDEAIETIARSLGLRVWRASNLLIGLSEG